MNIRLLLCCILLFLGAVTAMRATASAACPRYEIASYIVLPGCSWVGMTPRAMNVHGHACGSASCGIGDPHAWVWYGDDFITIPMPAGEITSEALDINDEGIVVGWVQLQDFAVSTYAFRFDGVTTELLPTLKEGNTSRAYSINNHGVIVGDSSTEQGISFAHAVRWVDGEIEDLALPDDLHSHAFLINDAGLIAMCVESLPFLMAEGKRTELPVFSGSSVGKRFGGLSENGVLAARLRSEDGEFVVVTWVDAELHELPAPEDFTDLMTTGIDARGHIVVGRYAEPGPGGPVIWVGDEPLVANRLVVLPASDFWLTSIWGVTENGQLLGSGGFLNEGIAMGLILEPIPPVPGDATCEGVVDFRDIIRVLSRWGSCDGCTGDLDENGNVGPGDLLIVLDHWGV